MNLWVYLALYATGSVLCARPIFRGLLNDIRKHRQNGIPDVSDIVAVAGVTLFTTLIWPIPLVGFSISSSLAYIWKSWLAPIVEGYVQNLKELNQVEQALLDPKNNFGERPIS